MTTSNPRLMEWHRQRLAMLGCIAPGHTNAHSIAHILDIKLKSCEAMLDDLRLAGHVSLTGDGVYRLGPEIAPIRFSALERYRGNYQAQQFAMPYDARSAYRKAFAAVRSILSAAWWGNPSLPEHKYESCLSEMEIAIGTGLLLQLVRVIIDDLLNQRLATVHHLKYAHVASPSGREIDVQPNPDNEVIFQ